MDHAESRAARLVTLDGRIVATLVDKDRDYLRVIG